MKYTSKGTVRVEFGGDGANGVLAAAKELLFVPDGDYSIKHGKKTFAVFVPRSGQPILREYGQDKEIRIKTDQVPPYDCTKTKVEIQVEERREATVATAEAATVVATTNAMKDAMNGPDRVGAAEVVERWESWERAIKRAKDATVDLKLISITIPAAK